MRGLPSAVSHTTPKFTAIEGAGLGAKMVFVQMLWFAQEFGWIGEARA
jgi:hypothetical protein